MTEFRMHHVNVMVDDLATAHSFYTDVLGLEPKPTPDLGFPAQFYKINDMQEIHMNEIADAVPERAHFALRVTDFESVFHRAHQGGVIETKTWGKARVLPGGVMQMFVRDPSGNLIEIATEPGYECDPTLLTIEDVFEPEEGFWVPDFV